MITSYPSIQAELSATEREFVQWVEARAGMQYADDYAVNFVVVVAKTEDDVSIERHAIEFHALGRNGATTPIGHIGHSIKRVESAQGQYAFIQTRFELAGPNIPDIEVRHDALERAVKLSLDRMKGGSRAPSRPRIPLDSRRFRRPQGTRRCSA